MAEAFEVVNYKSGAYIATEGQDELDQFYIIKKGRVERMAAQFLQSQKIRHKSEVLNVGDFFGVISCMAKRPRIETVVALEDTSVILISRTGFGSLIQNNTAIAMKIIRYFSRQLRYYDAILTALISKTTLRIRETDNANHLFEIAEHFFSQKNIPFAGYAFARYIQQNPNGSYAAKAKERMAGIRADAVKLSPRKEEHAYVYDDNQVIFLESEVGNELYVIREGKVRINKVHNGRDILLGVLNPGDIFGEMAIIENKPRNANAIAGSKVRLMAISKANFEYVVKTYPDIATKIIEILSDRIWLIYRQIANMFISDPAIKIYDALYTQLLKNRVPIARNASYVFDFSTDDLLKFTGMSSQEGKKILMNLLEADKSLTLNPDGKFSSSNLQLLEHKLNIIKRNLEIQQNLQSSEYSILLDEKAQ